ncbi:PUA-like domain-containing protein [Calycina marina]|uniref:Thymocyte nuclear protein 1 n=1 Tax=Calycina marina TaxID=1763456 RepID=A0A9P7Z2U8_9HELO|nr:PUA-like domain-containing protein [Calycina marina]
MVKRKADKLEGVPLTDEPRRTSRRISQPVKQTEFESEAEEPSPPPMKKTTKAKKAAANKNPETSVAPAGKMPSKAVKATKKPEKNGNNPDIPTSTTGQQFWLMKAEPESRFEKGHDIKFSIDDLAAKTIPEPWDGIRAYVGMFAAAPERGNSHAKRRTARNNLRAMKNGDLAFFYHSSCKVPAIVGIMEIVEEHSPDPSAYDSSKPYFDPKSSPDDPKWSIVKVEFRQKFETPITLTQLKAFRAEDDSPLKNMDMLRQTRISVSKVSEGEWNFLTAVVEKNGEKIYGR